MIDPTSDVGSIDESEAPTCEVCDAVIHEDPDHRVVTWIEDGTVHHRDFCSDECREEWLADNDVPG